MVYIINEVYKFTQFILAKDQNGYATPAQFNTAFKQASDWLFNRYYGLPESYQVNNPIPPIGYDLTQAVEDALLPFTIPSNMVIDSNGHGIRPADYVHVIGVGKQVKVTDKYCGDEAWKNYEWVDIDILTEDTWRNRLSSELVPVNAQNPVCRFYNNYIQFAPKNLLYCTFTYLRYPVTAVWAYTTVNDEPVFDPTNSVDTDWSVQMVPSLKAIVAYLFGINLNDETVIATTNEMKQRGN